MFGQFFFLLASFFAIHLLSPFSFFENSDISSRLALLLPFLFATYALIYVQKNWAKKSKILVVTELELFVALVALLLFFQASLGVKAILGTLHITFGLWLIKTPMLSFLFPFTLPFIAISFLEDFINLQGLSFLTVSTTILSFLALVRIFPLVLEKFWKLAPLKDFALSFELIKTCKSAHFSSPNLRVWSIFPHNYNAAILGIFPKARFILFTPTLLKTFPTDRIQAILAHEIGHTKHKHLFLYPLVFLLILLLTDRLLPYFLTPIVQLTSPLSPLLQEIVITLSLLATFLGLIALFFRFIFGFFSRLFERQADLYPLQLGLPVEAITGALEQLTFLSGKRGDEPCWHHASVEQRIAFLKEVAKNPSLIKKHHRKVHIALFFLLLFIIILSI